MSRHYDKSDAILFFVAEGTNEFVQVIDLPLGLSVLYEYSLN